MTFTPPIPKEHGSWVMLIVPLLLGSILAPVWHWRAPVLLTAAVGFFLIRYPLATLIKTRKRSKNNRAYLLSWAAVYGSISALSGGWLIFAHKLWWLALMGAVGVFLLGFNLWLIDRKQQMNLIGELPGIAGLALGAPMAYYAASGQLDQTALLLWLINALYFGGTVFYIKLKVRQQPRLPAPERLSERLIKAKACLAYQTIALIIIFILVALQQAPILAPLALIPSTVKVIQGASKWQDKKSLNLLRLGFIETLHSIAFTVLVIVAFL